MKSSKQRLTFMILSAILLAMAAAFVAVTPALAAVHDVIYVYNGYGQNPGTIVVKSLYPRDASFGCQPITLTGMPWPEMDGWAYLGWTDYWSFQVYEDDACTTPKLPNLGRPEYAICPAYDELEEGHVAPPECGNGVVESGEDCDDGNLIDGDGCESGCTLTWPPFGSLSYLFADERENPCGTSNAAIKWWDVVSGSDWPTVSQSYTGTQVTLMDNAWGLNGCYYLKWICDQGNNGWFELYHDADLTDILVTPLEHIGDYLGPGAAGYLLEDDPFWLCVSAVDLKEDAIDMLSDLYPTGDKKTDHRIDKAIEHIEKSLADELWEDDWHPTKKAKKVFNEEKKAVKELMKIDDPDVSDIIASLVGIDEHLAQTAIDEADEAAETACGDESFDPDCNKMLKEIAKAQKEMAKAAKELAKGKFDKAIEHYKKAWEHAQKAMNKVPEEEP